MTEPVVVVRDLWFSYGSQLVLRDVGLSIKRGEFLAVIGPNGGGKTTLIKLILGILKPDRGSIAVLGAPPGQASRDMGYVPQNTNIAPQMPITVMDVVLMGRLGHAGRSWRYSSRDRAAAEKALGRVGLLKFRNRSIQKLSGGQRQRVFIARALASEPEILFMDEPTASVDQEWQESIYDLLKELNETVTIVVVSHDVGVLSSHVKSVACVNQTLHFHDEAEITEEMLDKLYRCPVDLIAHGVPHRVLRDHEGES